MINRDIYETMKRKYGRLGSWAVWEPPGLRPKSCMGAENVFDLERNPALLQVLRNDAVMVGLNCSREFEGVFENFHDVRPRGKRFQDSLCIH
jgi:hypothetical protein